MLTIRSLNVAYGGLRALSDVSLDVERGQFVAVVGPNGAGKSTLFKTISGTVAPVSGEIICNGRNLLALPAAERAHFGIAHVPEGRQVFASMSVMENLEMGAYTRNGRVRRGETLPAVFELFPVLAERRNQLAGTLSGGEQQMLAIGRGLASAPDLLMLDEPSMGLAPKILRTVFDAIRKMNAAGTTILLVEQNARAGLRLSTHGVVMENGRVRLSGTGREVLENPEIGALYLGGAVNPG